LIALNSHSTKWMIWGSLNLLLPKFDQSYSNESFQCCSTLLSPAIEFLQLQFHYSLRQYSFTLTDQLECAPLRLGEVEYSLVSNMIAVFIIFDLPIHKCIMRLQDARERYLHPMFPILLPPE
jgi:hypothetical protein